MYRLIEMHLGNEGLCLNFLVTHFNSKGEFAPWSFDPTISLETAEELYRYLQAVLVPRIIARDQLKAEIKDLETKLTDKKKALAKLLPTSIQQQ